MKKSIGIIGSGPVAKALAKGFLALGHSVMLGTRDVNKLDEWKASEGQGAHVGSFASAAAFGQVLVLAVAGRAAEQALQMAGQENLRGKTIIDTTNPISEDPPVNGVLKFFTDLNGSLMEKLQNSFPGAHFVKSFSCVGNPFMVNPPFPDTKPTMFICGNNEPAKAEVVDFLESFGWDVADMGKAEAARAIEPLCILWCIPGFINNQWNHAFKLLKLS